MNEKFKMTRQGCKEAREFLISINRYNEIKTWWLRPDTHAILSFANKLFNKEQKPFLLIEFKKIFIAS